MKIKLETKNGITTLAAVKKYQDRKHAIQNLKTAAKIARYAHYTGRANYRNMTLELVDRRGQRISINELRCLEDKFGVSIVMKADGYDCWNRRQQLRRERAAN